MKTKIATLLLTLISTFSFGQWQDPTNGTGPIHYNGGNVGIGMDNPQSLLHIGRGTESELRIGTNPQLTIRKYSDNFILQVGGSGFSTYPIQLGRTDGKNDIIIPGGVFITKEIESPRFRAKDGSDKLVIEVNNDENYSRIRWGDNTDDRLSFMFDNWDGTTLDKEVMTLLPSGNVGIGTTSPDHELHVVGSTLLKGETKITGPLLFAKGMESVLANSTNPAIYETHDMDADYPFNTSGHLVIQPETTYSKDIVLMTGNHTPNVRMVVLGNGKVGIGTRTPTAKLSVAGTMDAREIKVEVEAGSTPDYVFADHYELRTLEETASYIEENHHLPETPSAKEMEANGMNVGEMNLLLLKKIEELTLHLIKIEKENKLQSQEITQLKKLIK